MSSPAHTTGYTYEDLASFPDDGLRRELIDGELIVSPAPRFRHQDVVGELIYLLRAYSKEHGGKACPAPLDVVFSDKDVVEPDVLFIRPEHLHQIDEQCIRSAPDLVIEVSSPSTHHLEHVRKRNLYERYGVPEYWYVDLEANRVEIWRLKDGRYSSPEILERGDKLTCPLLPGFAVTIEDLLEP
jgi:Uma2 family endonuclease